LRAGVLAAAITAVLIPGFASAQQAASETTELDRVSVTGSRIKRAEMEGALPVVVIDRAQIEASGQLSVADFLRNTSFNSFGSYQSSSGNSFIGASFIDMRGLGQGRTLVLIDGRRAPVSPQAGSGNDLNTIPLAAVERFEILSDGASAIYGSDAIGGVINVITKKDFEGIEISAGRGYPRSDGADTEQASVLIGTSGERGRLLGGASYESRDIIYTRDRDLWMSTPGQTTFANNFYRAMVNPNNTFYGFSPTNRLNHPVYGSVVPGGCEDGLFYTTGSGAGTLCQFDHKQQSARMSQTSTTAVFVRGDYQVNDRWLSYFNATASRAKAYGQFASVPSSPWPGESIFIPVGSPNHPGNPGGYNAGNTAGYDPAVPYFLRHRFAASGTRNSHAETTTYDFLLGFQGQVGTADVDFGVRYNESSFLELGENYVVGGLAQQAINDGSYNIYDPYNNPASVVDSFTATTSRNSRTVNKELYASAGFDLFTLPGGTARAVFGAEYREETYADIYDRLSEAGQIVGSAGNSAAGGRDAAAAYFEALFPLLNGLELNLAGRYDDYSDYGNDFSPKVSLRWHPLEHWTFRASWGEGFRAPSLDILTQRPAFSAVTLSAHRPTCNLQGVPATSPCSPQVNTYGIANPGLESENSEQYGLGAVWDAASWLNLSLDYYHIKVNNQIRSFGLAAIVNCLRGAGGLCPDGLSEFPVGTVLPNPGLGLGITVDAATGGIVNGQTGFTNLGRVETEGFDFAAHTTFDFGDIGNMNNRLQMSYVSTYKTNNGESIVGRGLLDTTTPRIRATLSNSWSRGSVSVTWNINYIHGTQSQAWRDIVADDRAGDPSDPDVLALPKRLPSWVIHDVQVTWEAPWKARLSLGVNNLADRQPVVDPYFGDDFNEDVYNTWGRVPYFRYTQRF